MRCYWRLLLGSYLVFALKLRSVIQGWLKITDLILIANYCKTVRKIHAGWNYICWRYNSPVTNLNGCGSKGSFSCKTLVFRNFLHKCILHVLRCSLVLLVQKTSTPSMHTSLSCMHELLHSLSALARWNNCEIVIIIWYC